MTSPTNQRLDPTIPDKHPSLTQQGLLVQGNHQDHTLKQFSTTILVFKL